MEEKENRDPVVLNYDYGRKRFKNLFYNGKQNFASRRLVKYKEKANETNCSSNSFIIRCVFDDGRG
jgi:hypothetical protein